MGSGITNATAVGWGQQTPAIQATARLAAGVRSATGGRRRRRKAKRASAAPRKRRRRASGKTRLVKGSAAAKRYMAKIRRMRKRK